jgi:hypothetical protein
MSQTKLIAPVENMTGKFSSASNGRVIVNRRKCYGKDAKGRSVCGPLETYVYHCHKGKWSEGSTQNRSLFQQVQLAVKEELSNSERVAYWQELFDQQFLGAKQGERRYATLRGFVIAQLHRQMKNASDR